MLEVKMDFSTTVRDFIVENFLFGDGEKLNNDTSFMEEGIIDSTGILELVLFIEENFGIKVEDDELVPENMDNLNNINMYLAKKTQLTQGSC